MQQTICGEIPRTSIHERKEVEEFLETNKDLFSKLSDSEKCMYESGKIVSDTCLNYLNSSAINSCHNQLKILIKKEFTECEKTYPFLGDYFVNQYFQPSSCDYEKYILNSDNYELFLSSLNFETVKKLTKFIFECTNLSYSINLNKTVLKDIHVEKIDFLNFSLEYDNSFLGNMTSHEMKEYKFIIVDGYIDSVGEIHHLLESAYKTKEPYVIFCFGMSEEVQHVIKYNNTHSEFEVFPVVIEFNENTLNVLNDIAVLHQSTIVSANTGQTISQALREDLKVGKSINFHKGGFKIEPLASDYEIQIHREFLRKRIDEAQHEESKSFLIERLKRFSSKTVNIFLPEHMFDNNDFIREIDYAIRFIKNCQSVFLVFKMGKRNYFLPVELVSFVKRKIKSLNHTFNNIEQLVINARN